MHMKKKLKGFTLIELIMVMALFAIIMYSVLQLMDPVTKYFVRSSNFEGSTACYDNLKRAVEGNLKYADRVRAYWHYQPYRTTDDITPSNVLNESVADFYDKFFANRKGLDTAGYIYVLVLDNTALSASDLQSDIYPDTKTFNSVNKLGKTDGTGRKGQNSGRIILYRYWFNNYDTRFDTADEVIESVNIVNYTAPTTGWAPAGFTPEPGIQDWYVNRMMYSNYEYRFDLGLVEQAKDDEGNLLYEDEEKTIAKMVPIITETGKYGEFIPSDFTLTVTMTELRKNQEGPGLVREPNQSSGQISFSMKNVLDSATHYMNPRMDYKLTGDEDETDFEYTSESIPRYYTMFKKAPVTDVTKEPIDPDGTKNMYFDGGYFIFTQANTTFTNPTAIDNQKPVKLGS